MSAVLCDLLNVCCQWSVIGRLVLLLGQQADDGNLLAIVNTRLEHRLIDVIIVQRPTTLTFYSPSITEIKNSCSAR